MGHHKLHPLSGAKHHRLNNAVYIRKLLIWSLAILLPFLLLFCIFPSSTSLYNYPSYNRIVVGQLQLPASRILQPQLSAHVHDPQDDENLPSNDDDDHSSDEDDDNSMSTSEMAMQQSDAATAADNSGVGDANSSTNKQSHSKETQALSKVQKQNHDKNFASLSLDGSTHLSTYGDGKDMQSDRGNDKRKQSNTDDESDASAAKAKKLKDGEEGDHDFSMKQSESGIDDELNLSSKKSKQQTSGDGDESEINEFMLEEEQNRELEEEGQNKKNRERNAERESKKNIKKGKGTKESPELELDEALSLSAKEEVDQPNIAQNEIEKSTKKAKAVHDTDGVAETELNEAETVAKKKKADRNDGGPSTAKLSRKEKVFATDEEEGNFANLGKESSLEEANPKQSSRKAMGLSYDKEAAADEADDAEKEVSFSGKKSKSKMEEVEQEEGEEGAIQMGQKDGVSLREPKKKRTQRGGDLEDMEDGDFTSHSKHSLGTCNYFKGSWSMDSNYSPYSESTCPWTSIDDDQSCKSTTETSAWRWKPNECSMKQFKGKAYLKLMQGKSMAFVGDKMVKAQLKSLVCLLAKVETPTLLYNSNINQSMSWHFSSSNITISLIWSPYLVQETSEGGHYSKLQLDKLDTKWAEMFPTVDVLVLGVGTQFAQPTLYKVKDDVVGCYSCQGLSTHIDITNFKEISLYSGFRAAMRSSIMGIGALPGYNGIVMFLQPFGFEGKGSYYGVSMKMKDIQEQELKKAHRRGSISNQSRMEVLHTYLKSESNLDPIKGLYSPTCLIPSPFADMWNQVLQHTLTQIFTLESDS